MNVKKVTVRKAWSDNDVCELVEAYNLLLNAQEQGVNMAKAPLVRELMASQERSKGSIECKLMNVSVVYVKEGFDFVKGYKPLSNINKALIDQVKTCNKWS